VTDGLVLPAEQILNKSFTEHIKCVSMCVPPLGCSFIQYFGKIYEMASASLVPSTRFNTFSKAAQKITEKIWKWEQKADSYIHFGTDTVECPLELIGCSRYSYCILTPVISKHWTINWLGWYNDPTVVKLKVQICLTGSFDRNFSSVCVSHRISYYIAFSSSKIRSDFFFDGQR